MKILITLLIGIAIGFFIGQYLTERSIQRLWNDEIKGSPTFSISSNLSCTIVNSTQKDRINENISFINVETSNPTVLFGNSGTTSPMTKVTDDSEMVVLQLITAAGSIDAFNIDKKSGVFTRISAGKVFHIYAAAAKGYCK